MEQVTTSVDAVRFKCDVCGRLYEDETSCEVCECYHRRFDFDRTLYHAGDIVRLASDDNAYKITKVCVDSEKKAITLRVSVLQWGILEWDRKTSLVCSAEVTGHCPGEEYQRMEKAAKDLRGKLNDMGILSSFRLQWNQSKLKVNITIECV